ncbi:T9SS type A sorting domain-containing protein [Candidatus Cloacimonadota bacterium]
MKTIILFLFLLSTFTTLMAQTPPDTLWTFHTGDPNRDDALISIQQTNDAGFICSGYCYPDSADYLDYWLLKLTGEGELEWETKLGGDYTDYTFCVRETFDLGFILAGTTSSFGVDATDFWLVKTDPQGNLVWDHTYGGFSYDFCQHVEQTEDGGYIMTGYTISYGNGDYDIWVIKTDASGEIVWDITYGGEDGDYGECVIQTADLGYIICGFTYSVDIGTSDALVVKLDSEGNVIWSETYGFDGWDYSYSIQQTSDSGFILAGTTELSSTLTNQAVLWKLDSNGNQEWSWEFGGIYDENITNVIQTSDEGYVFSGLTSSYGNGQEDAWIFKTDNQGYFEWAQTMGFSGEDTATDVIQTWNGDYVLCTVTNHFNGTDDPWIIRFGNGVAAENPQIQSIPGTLKIFPNPFRYTRNRDSGLGISFENKTNSFSQITIFDLRGRVVYRTRTDLDFVVWNGLDMGKKELGNGLYYCKVTSNSQDSYTKFVILK